jgi:DNA-binding response OmpR family regulator
MQLLIAHGDAAARLALKLVAADLPASDLDVIESGDGMETLDVLLAADSALVAVIDWDLPGCDGPELCRLVRAYRHAGPPYIILLAGDGYRLAEGLEAGADDCVHTPAGADELRARINVGRRFAALPWERVMRAATSDPQGVARHVLHAVPELDALRSPEDDELAVADAAPASRFELQSVLVAH